MKDLREHNINSERRFVYKSTFESSEAQVCKSSLFLTLLPLFPAVLASECLRLQEVVCHPSFTSKLQQGTATAHF